MIKNMLFMRACLDASRPTPGFCDEVPRRLEFVRSAEWELQQCKRYGLSPEKQCQQLFQQVQQFCEERGRFQRPDENSDDEDTEPPPPPPAPAPRHNSNSR
jgi:hypothetical protein